MSYTAKHFVKIAWRMYTPGEIIDNPIPDDKLQRLLRLNAVEAIEAVGACHMEGRSRARGNGRARRIADRHCA